MVVMFVSREMVKLETRESVMIPRPQCDALVFFRTYSRTV